jgi:hypothetical protein
MKTHTFDVKSDNMWVNMRMHDSNKGLILHDIHICPESVKTVKTGQK